MVKNGYLTLPVLDLGNAIIVLQPSRGWHEDPNKIYHDSELYPHHQYVALYRWLEEVWRADAVIHVGGTHGTLEFLPGKQVGLSSSCPPQMRSSAIYQTFISTMWLSSVKVQSPRGGHTPY